MLLLDLGVVRYTNASDIHVERIGMGRVDAWVRVHNSGADGISGCCTSVGL